jgi:hypothetical protein
MSPGMTLHWGQHQGRGAASCRFPPVGGENSAEQWLRVGEVSAKSPTSRKGREKWGTRPHPSDIVISSALLHRLFQLANSLLQGLPLGFLLVSSRAFSYEARASAVLTCIAGSAG